MNHFINMKNFLPEDIVVIKMTETSEEILLKLKSKTKIQLCPLCKQESSSYHSTYIRKIQDIPIYGKPVVLQVIAYKYYCDNTGCSQKVFCEELDGFTGKYRRMTFRCEDLVTAIAINTNCEVASLMCNYMGIKVNGDTVIRLLLSKSRSSSSYEEVNDIGNHVLKDYSKHRINICDNHINGTSAFADGWNREELKKWLKTNRHAKKITPLKAEYYASAILEGLPHTIRITDRAYSLYNIFYIVRDAIDRVESILSKTSN